MKTRVEKDCIGKVHVPADAYYGSFTTRARENFPITGTTMPLPFQHSLALVKKAALHTNTELQLISKKHSKAIEKAINEFIEGKFNDNFCIDRYQAGAGTPFNMNFNEIIANRANEILKGKKGAYSPIHPNNHINMSQSSNDLIPTVGRIACLLEIKPLLKEIQALTKAFKKIAQKHKNQIKVGRTHLEDAVPMTVHQEFNAFATNVEKNINRIESGFNELREIGFGATALGSGINTHPEYRKKVIKNLSRVTKLKLKPTKDYFEIAQSMDAFVQASNALRIYAINLIKIANDLKLLNMGPKAGLHEITLPEVQPGSSIMPGKINPSIPECIHQIGYQVLGYDHTITMSAQAGQLQLNVMGPLIILNLLEALSILTNGTKMLRTKCINGIKVNTKTIDTLFNNSLCVATALNPYIGYEVTAEIVKEALKKDISIAALVAQKEFMSEKDLKKILSPNTMTKPGLIDTALATRIQKNKNYQSYKKKITS